MLLQQLCGVLEKVVDADNYLLPAEIRSYSELLRIVDVAGAEATIGPENWAPLNADPCAPPHFGHP